MATSPSAPAGPLDATGSHDPACSHDAAGPHDAGSRDATEVPSGARGAALMRDVILGGQDGLVNVLGLVLGMAVATGSTRVVVTAGLAALLAESIAMAGVAFTSAGAERQIGASLRQRLDARREAAGQARSERRAARLSAAGVAPNVAAIVMAETAAESEAWRQHVDVMRSTLAPVRETRPARAAAVVGLSTALGSSVPLLPFILLPISIAPFAALAAGAIVLALAGIERARTTGGRKLRSAVEMVGIGLVSALAGYLIGQLLRGPVV